MHQLLSFDLADQLPLALFELGDDIGEIGHDALRIFIGIEQIVGFVFVEKGTQRARRVTRIAMTRTETATGDFFHRLGEHPSDAREAVGAGEGDFIDMQLDPAVLEQQIEHPVCLLAFASHGKHAVIFTVIQNGRARNRFLEDLEHQIAADHAAVIGKRAVQPRIQRPQASHDLFAIFARQGTEKVLALVGEQHVMPDQFSSLSGVISLTVGK